MQRQLEGGEWVRYRELGAGRAEEDGRARKAIHVLDARQPPVSVYIVESDAGETVVLGDGENVEKLPRDSR